MLEAPTIRKRTPLALIVLTVSALALNASVLSAQPTPSQPEQPRGQGLNAGRPTKVTDVQPLFDFAAYFLGTWTAEWDMPEGALGPGVTLTGTTTFTKVDAAFFEASTTWRGLPAAVTSTERIAYRAEGKTLSRVVTDSRGFNYQEIGSVGGDLGGTFALYLESAPFKYQGKVVRVRNNLRLTSPLSFRNAVTVSTDGGPFVNYGTAWYTKSQATQPR